jgi:hypothetical protein
MQITKRDIKIFELLYLFQCLQVLQIAKLFRMNIKVCQRRLRKLCISGYLQKRIVPSTMPGASPLLYYLGAHGASLLGVAISTPRFTRQLSHQQKSSDIMIDMFLAFQEAGDIEFRLLPEHIIRISNQHNGVIPDGSFTLQKGDKCALYLIENCSGTEIIQSPSYNEDIESKIVRYSEIFKNNEIQYYSNYYEYTFNRFRLLYINNSEKRLESISKIVAEHDKHGFILLTTLQKLKQHGVDASIWFVPATGELNQKIV